MASKRRNPINQFGEAVLGLVFLVWLWSAVSVLCNLTNTNPLMFSLRGQYRELRGLDQ